VISARPQIVVKVFQLKGRFTDGTTWGGVWEIASAQVSSLPRNLVNFSFTDVVKEM